MFPTGPRAWIAMATTSQGSRDGGKAQSQQGMGSDTTDRAGRESHTPALLQAAHLGRGLGCLGCQGCGAGWGSEMGKEGWRSQKGPEQRGQLS